MLSITVWDPDASVAQLAVKTIIQSYQQLYEEDRLESQNHLMAVLQGRLDKESADVKSISTSIRSVAAKYGTDDLQHLFDRKSDELDDLTKRLADVSSEVGQSSEVVTRIKSQIEKCRSDWQEMSRDKMALDDFKDEKARVVAALHQTQDRIDSLQVESSGSGSRLDIISDGDSPSPAADISDTHFALAGLGGAAGLAAAATLALTFGWRRRTA
jgi:predicted nuclease with TOPRIM domain